MRQSTPNPNSDPGVRPTHEQVSGVPASKLSATRTKLRVEISKLEHELKMRARRRDTYRAQQAEREAEASHPTREDTSADDNTRRADRVAVGARPRSANGAAAGGGPGGKNDDRGAGRGGALVGSQPVRVPVLGRAAMTGRTRTVADEPTREEDLETIRQALARLQRADRERTTDTPMSRRASSSPRPSCARPRSAR